MPTFEYFAQNPDMLATFNAAMAEHTRAIAPEVVKGYDFSRFGTLVYVGGGNGTLLAQILNAAPDSKGVLFDLPNGVQRAAETLRAAGVADRCRVVTGDFFESVPDGADAYLLKSVIHDWDDDRSVAILRNCSPRPGSSCPSWSARWATTSSSWARGPARSRTCRGRRRRVR